MPGGRRSLSLLLLVPAGLVWALALVWPTIRLIAGSLEQDNLITGKSAYHLVFTAVYGGFVLRALSLWLLPLVVFVGVGLVVGWAGSRSGRRVRLVARCMLAVPVACFAPAVAIGAWLSSGAAHAGAVRPHAADIRLLMLVGTFGLVCTVGSAVYLAAFRTARPFRTVVAVTGFAALAFLATGVQEVNVPYVAGHLGAAVPVPADLAWRETAIGNFGVAAAHLVVMFVLAAVLGLGAVGLLIATGTRLVAGTGASPASPPVSGRRAEGVLLAVVVLVLAATGYTSWPWLRSLFADGVPSGYHAGHVLADTWFAPLPSVVMCLVTALPAAFCIGALRPLGRRTDLLLLPFAPWLFAGVAQVAVVHLLADSTGPLKRVQGLEALTEPIWLSVPALIIFTLLFRGQTAAYQTAVARGVPPGRAMMEAYLRPMWPAVVLAGLAMWVVEASDFAWPAFALGFSAEQAAATNVYANALSFSGVRPAPSAGIVTPVALVVLVMLLAILAQFYLDRLAIRVQSREVAAKPSTVDGLVPAQRVPRDRPPLATAAPPRAYRVILACAGLGLALALTAITVSCAASGTGPELPSLPGAPAVPGVVPSTDSIIRGR